MFFKSVFEIHAMADAYWKMVSTKSSPRLSMCTLAFEKAAKNSSNLIRLVIPTHVTNFN